MKFNWLKPGRGDRIINVAPGGAVDSLVAARDAIRALPAAERSAAPIRVLVHDGRYELAGALQLGPEDSGTPSCPVIYQAAPGATPRLSGGRRLLGWREETVAGRRAWRLTIPEVARGEWHFTQLLVDGRRRPRARLPEQGCFLLREVAPGPGVRAGKFQAGDLCAWPDLADAEFILAHYWVESHLRVESLDMARSEVVFTTAGVRPLDDELRRGACRYWVENVLAGLTTPGQWHWSRRDGVLTYLPLASEELGRSEMVAPCLDHLLAVAGEGDPAKSVCHSNPGARREPALVPASPAESLAAVRAASLAKVHDVHFVGLDFRDVEWDYAPGCPGAAQAAFTVPGALRFRHACECSVRLCRLGPLGGYAVEIGEGCHHLAVVGNRMDDLGGGGVKVGHGSHFNLVSDNTITRGGRRFASAVGIWVGHSGDNTVIHNHLGDFFYTGISVGWVWGYGPSLARRNRIEHNHIHHIGQGLLSDMGGVYSLGASPGTSISHNLIQEVRCFGYGGNGLYPDEGSSFIIYDGNLVVDTDSGSIHMNYGRDVKFRNNILVNSREVQITWGTPKHFRPMTLENNIVQWHEGAAVQGNWFAGMPLVEFAGNLYWHESGRVPDFSGHDWSAWQARGFDRRGRIVDALLAAPENGWPTLRADSPAARRGFRRMTVDRAGPRAEVLRTGIAPQHEREIGPLVWVSLENALGLPCGAKYEDRYLAYPETTPCAFTMQAVMENAGDRPFHGVVCFAVEPAACLEAPIRASVELHLEPGERQAVPLALRVKAGVEEIVLRADSAAAGFLGSVLGLGFRPVIKVARLPREATVGEFRERLSDATPLSVNYGRFHLATIRLGMCGDALALVAAVNDSRVERLEPVYKGSMIDLFGMGSPDVDATGQAGRAMGQVFLVPGTADSPAALTTIGLEKVVGGELAFAATPPGYEVAARIPLAALGIKVVDDEFAFKAAVYTHLPGATGIVRAHLFNERQRTDIHAYGKIVMA